MRGKSPEETAMDLVIEDGSRVGTVYFLMSEDNVKREVGAAVDELRLRRSVRGARGRVPQVEQPPARLRQFRARCSANMCATRMRRRCRTPIRRLTSLPATNLGITPARLRSKPGYYADVVVFDPATIQDHATFEKPQQLATGVDDVFVNGVQVLKDGKHTGAKPGRVVRGPGWTGWPGGGACK